MAAAVNTRRALKALRGAASAVACLLAGGALAAPAAQAHRLELRPLDPTAAESVRLFHPRVPDRVRPTVLHARAASRAHAAASAASFRTADGVNIPVAVSA